jgi:hypothetical protein
MTGSARQGSTAMPQVPANAAAGVVDCETILRSCTCDEGVSRRPILSFQPCATVRVYDGATSRFGAVIDRVYLQLRREYERAGGGVLLKVHMRQLVFLELG